MSLAEHGALAPRFVRDEIPTIAASAPRRIGVAAEPPRSRGSLVRRMLLLVDVLALSAVFLASALIQGAVGSAGAAAMVAELLLSLVFVPAYVLAAKLYGLYDARPPDHSTVDDLVPVFHAVAIAIGVFTLAAHATAAADRSLPQLIALWAFAVASIAAGRAVARALCRRSSRYSQNTIIVGAGEIGQLIGRKLQKHPEYGLNLLGFVDGAPKDRRADLDDLTVLGAPHELRDLVARFGVERIVVAFSNESAEATRDLVRNLNDLDVEVDVVPRLFEIFGPTASVHSVEGLPLVGINPGRLAGSSQLLKRAADVTGSVLALTLLAPLMAYIAWRIKRDSPGPVFFRQTRLGLNMREFTVLKFRTMKVDTKQDEHWRYIHELAGAAVATNANGLFKLDRADAITLFGRWLRKTSLDELPQLINVLRGDMSLVGPRPCIPYETEIFASHHFERFTVPAGITGLWQVTARANSTFAEALDMDVAYARGWSFGLDLRLLLRTPFQLLRQRGATA